MPVQALAPAAPETPNHGLPTPEAAAPQPELHDYAGSAAMDAQTAEGIARLNAMANGEHVAEDDTRMFDIQAAEEAAYAEQATRREADRIQDVELAHEMALKEEAARAAEAKAAAEAEAQAAEAQAAQQRADNKKADADKAAAEVAAAQAPVVREAVAALKQAGQGEAIPAGSTVTKEPNGDITIASTDGSAVKVLEASPLGGYEPVDYTVNPLTRTVTITRRGLTTLLGAPGETVGAADGSHTGGDHVALPPAVAKAAGFKSGVRLGAPAPQNLEVNKQQL
ncbi:MAG TPA: hypothetical protein VLF71_05850 [Candidatus Saccharimonadales bacterium]|nr:hypothetical protein [Candidatus Saccharimonadales bacterium]